MKVVLIVIGLLLTLYVARSLVHGNIAIRPGMHAVIVKQQDNPVGFWLSVGLYVFLILVLFLGF